MGKHYLTMAMAAVIVMSTVTGVTVMIAFMIFGAMLLLMGMRLHKLDWSV
jgi:hypothetical protein